MSEADDRLKEYALRHGVSVVLESGRVFNAAGQVRSKKPPPTKPKAQSPVPPELPKLPTSTAPAVADVAAVTANTAPPVDHSPRIAELEAQINGLRAEVQALVLRLQTSALQPQAPQAPMASYAFEVTQRDPDGFFKAGVFRPEESKPDTLESRIVERAMKKH